MDNFVIIKANPHGIVLILDKELGFDKLKEHITTKFRDSSKFLGNARTVVNFEGRELSDDEKNQILDIIASETKLQVAYIMEHDEVKDLRFKRTLELYDDKADNSSSIGQFVKGNLRSGQVLEMKTSVVIIGDVNPGAIVTSNGNIVIIGALKGTAYAGASGNENAFVFALDMNPVQIRIADIIARAPDQPRRRNVSEGKIAFLENGSICVEQVNRRVLSEIRI